MQAQNLKVKEEGECRATFTIAQGIPGGISTAPILIFRYGLDCALASHERV